MSNALLTARKRVGTGPIGRWILATAVSFQAPYFRSIHPLFDVFDPGHVVVRLRKRRGVTNHLGTVHAIAMCNAAELAAGTAMELTVDPSLRWIPVGMEVAYLKLAKTDLTVSARTDALDLASPGDVVVPVVATDTAGQVVFTADIRMRLSARKASA